MAGCSNPKAISVGKPQWLRKKLPSGPEYEQIRKMVKEGDLHTVCQEAKCPNQFECYGRGTATFMILGDRCTRNCRFCAVDHQPVAPPQLGEPARVAAAVAKMGLRYAVITSVTRDDLADGGAALFAETIRRIRHKNPNTLVEVLIPDLQGDWQALRTLLADPPDVLNHNMETVAGLYPVVRPQAIYQRSLELLAEAKKVLPRLVTKSGLMLGLGETHAELEETWHDLRAAHCDILTMGQYLQPSAEHLPVSRFVEPEEFTELGRRAALAGFAGVASGPFVRSSYEAEQLYNQARSRLAES